MKGLFMLLPLWMPGLVHAITIQQYNVEQHYHATGGTLLQDVSRKDMTSLACARLCVPPCWTATYSPKENKCMTYKDLIYHSSLTLASNSDWNVLWKADSLAETVKHDTWTLVFRAQTGIKKPLYDVWVANDVHNDRPVGHNISLDCLDLNLSSNCHNHFRSFILDEWNNLKISQVKFSIYKDGIERQYILFNGSGSDFKSWFRKERIMSSSWDVETLRNMSYFSLEGITFNVHERRFYVFNEHRECPNDSGIFFVLDAPTAYCADWQIQNQDSYPLFLYSPTDREVKMADAAYDYADVLAVFVQFSIF